MPGKQHPHSPPPPHHDSKGMNRCSVSWSTHAGLDPFLWCWLRPWISWSWSPQLDNQVVRWAVRCAVSTLGGGRVWWFLTPGVLPVFTLPHPPAPTLASWASWNLKALCIITYVPDFLTWTASSQGFQALRCLPDSCFCVYEPPMILANMFVLKACEAAALDCHFQKNKVLSF